MEGIMKRILFVCIGNCHRSPIAEVIANAILRERGLAGEYEAFSRGTHAGGGGLSTRPRDWESAKPVLAELGVIEEASRHVPRRVSDEDLAGASVVVAMDYGVWQGLVADSAADVSRVRCFTELSDGRRASVNDPIGGTEDEFQTTYEYVNRTLRDHLATLIQWTG